MSEKSTYSKLVDLGLDAFATAFVEQESDFKMKDMPFSDRLTILVDIETQARRNKTLKRLIQNADFDQPSAHISDIDYESGRKLDKDRILDLASCKYIEDNLNVIITGATGSGKTYLACALGMEACKRLYTTKYTRLPDFLADIESSKKVDKYKRAIDKYIKPALLIIDEWLLVKPTQQNICDIFELINARSGKSSTILCSQYNKNGWIDQLNGDKEPLAESILDRLVHSSYEIDIVPIDPNNSRSMREIYGLKYKDAK